MLPNGDVLVVGGTESSGAALPAERWNQDTEVFEVTDIVSGQYGHTANLLPDGRVLITGGLLIGQESSPEAELIEPARRPE